MIHPLCSCCNQNKHNNQTNFIETRLGQTYITHTIPELAKSIDKLATVLESSNDTIKLQVAHSIRPTLEKLAYANIQSDFFERVGGSHYYQVTVPALTKALNELVATLETINE